MSMPNPNTLSLKSIIDITVEVSPMAAPRPTFNQALFLGSSTVIPISERVREYETAAAMIADTFSPTSPEYLAALLYFAQSPAPDVLWVGRQDLTVGALKTISVGTSSFGGLKTINVDAGNKGSGYSPDDVLTIVQAGGSLGTAKVLTIGDGGLVASVEILTAGEHYSVATALATTVAPSGGTGCKIDLTVITNGTGYSADDVLTIVQSGGALGTATVLTVGAESGEVLTIEKLVDGSGYAAASGLPTTVSPNVGIDCLINISAVTPETILEALNACRAANFDWYAGVCLEADKQDHIDIAHVVETMSPPTVYGFTTHDAAVPLGTGGNIFETLKGSEYSRTFGQYSTDSFYAICAILGYAMGQNTGLANSAYTLKFKGEVEIATEDVTTTIRGRIEGNNGNLYLSYGNYYNIFEQGVMADGRFFDEILNIDMLVSDIQLNVMDLLYGTPKIPQTDAGQTQLLHAVNQACELAVNRGFIGPGTWTGPTMLNLKTDDVLPKGYLAQSESYSTQTRAKREARESMPIYLAIKEAGAVHSLAVLIYVNR